METSMYYTFSTIAQVLAAFIALSGLFVIFKIQSLWKAMLYQANIFYRITQDFNNGDMFITNILPILNEAIESNVSKEILSRMDEILKNGSEISGGISSLTLRRNIFSKINNNRSNILKLTKISLTIGVLTIFLSIFFLSITHNPNFNSHCWPFIIGLVGVVISVVLMVWAIFISLLDNDIDIGKTKIYKRTIKTIKKIFKK